MAVRPPIPRRLSCAIWLRMAARNLPCGKIASCHRSTGRQHAVSRWKACLPLPLITVTSLSKWQRPAAVALKISAGSSQSRWRRLQPLPDSMMVSACWSMTSLAGRHCMRRLIWASGSAGRSRNQALSPWRLKKAPTLAAGSWNGRSIIASRFLRLCGLMTLTISSIIMKKSLSGLLMRVAALGMSCCWKSSMAARISLLILNRSSR